MTSLGVRCGGWSARIGCSSGKDGLGSEAHSGSGDSGPKRAVTPKTKKVTTDVTNNKYSILFFLILN